MPVDFGHHRGWKALSSHFQIVILDKAIMSEVKKSPTPEEIEDVLLSCRYGDLEDVQAFVEQFGDEPLKTARDDRGNNVIHMCCGNGHTGE